MTYDQLQQAKSLARDIEIVKQSREWAASAKYFGPSDFPFEDRITKEAGEVYRQSVLASLDGYMKTLLTKLEAI